MRAGPRQQRCGANVSLPGAKRADGRSERDLALIIGQRCARPRTRLIRVFTVNSSLETLVSTLE